MKIYCGFTVVGDRAKLELVSHLMMLLQARGHKVLTTHLLSKNVFQEDAAKGAEFVFERDMRWLNEADVVIAEVTNKSFGVGFEIGHAAASKKKVYLLYEEPMKEGLSKMIIGNTLKNCIRVPYGSMQDINKFVEKYF